MRFGVDGRVLTDRYPGIGRALFAVAPHLAGGPDEIVMIRGPEPESDRFPMSALAKPGLEIHDVDVGLRSIREQLALSPEIRKLHLDAVLTPYFATSLRWPCPRVTIVHDLIPLTVSGSMPSRAERLVYRLLLRAALARSRTIVVPSRATADSLLRVFPGFEARTSVIPDAVDTGLGSAGRSEIEAVRSRHELGPSHVLTVAGDRPHKNLARLVAAWEALDPADRGGTVLALAGSPSPRVDHPSVRVLGAVPDRDLRALYAGATAVAVPSLDEGFGLPVAEAMACGTAVVCSDRPALREVAGDGAILFNPHDVASIGEALARILNEDNLRSSLEQSGPERLTRFSPGLIAGQLLDELRVAAQSDGLVA